MVGAFLIAAAPAIASEIEIQYTPLDRPTVEAAEGYQWHPPMALPPLPVSLQVDRPGVESIGEQAARQPYMFQPGMVGMPPVGPSGWED